MSKSLTRRSFLKTAGLGSLALCIPGKSQPRLAWLDALLPGSDAHSQGFYVGTYTSGKSKGIYYYGMDPSGALTEIGATDGMVNPTFLTIDRQSKHLYAVDESTEFNGKPGGGVSAFAIDPRAGALTALGWQSTVGTGPCHIVLDRSGKFALVANYGSGSVAMLPVNKDGSLAPASDFIQHKGHSINPKRQEGPHAHCVAIDRANRFALVADLGLDKILVYRMDLRRGKLISNNPPFVEAEPGAGPRHLLFDSTGRRLYCINEMGGAITRYAYDPVHGVLRRRESVKTLPADYSGPNTAAELALAPSGRFLYGSNRGHNSIVIFAVAPGTGRLSYVAHQPTGGRTPRNFVIDPSGKFLLVANQDTDNVVVFRIGDDGKLTPTDNTASVPSPVCLLFRTPA